MNATIFYDVESNLLHLITHDEVSRAYASIEGELEFTKPEGEEGDKYYAVGVSLALLFDSFASYSLEERKSMVVDFTFGEHSSVLIRQSKDKIILPCKYIPAYKAEEIHNDIFNQELSGNNDEDWLFNMASFGEGQTDFLKGLDLSKSFLSKNEKSNNAYAIYNDRVIVNDERHVFVYRLNNHAHAIKASVPFASLHKLPVKILSIFNDQNSQFYAVMEGQEAIVIYTDSFMVTINNSFASIKPPSAERLEALIPKTLLTRLPVGQLLKACHFFDNYYRSGSEYQPLTIEVCPDGIKFLLKDSGINGSASANAEKFIECEITDDGITNNPVSATFLNSSLQHYLSGLPKADSVDIYHSEDAKCVFLRHPKQSIYLAKTDD